jgi:pyruvate dehydrogenase E2 component (dihydrolipoamide acetyltransferase)
VGNVTEVKVPDLGGAKDVNVIEVLVAAGQTISKEQALITLESDKASMEVPSPVAGLVKDVKIKVGDKVSEGSLIVLVEASAAAQPVAAQAPAPSAPATAPAPVASPAPAPTAAAPAPVAVVPVSSGPVDENAFRKAHASPSVRLFARELGVDLGKVSGSGPKGRITSDDVKAYVKSALSKVASGSVTGGSGIPAMPEIDFSKFGEIEIKPLSRINKLTGANLHRAWLNVPAVTQFDQADITDMEAFRKENGALAEKKGFKLTPLAFLLKACGAALKQFPRFNSSLDPAGENLILKKYVHIGVAVDTPDGLVVPVIRDVDKKSLFDLAKELGEISVKAREKKLKNTDMQGACFTISSLGGIGGTAFTPIVNAPEVAILGVSKSSMQPVYKDGNFVPRLMLPLSLSYDHRVIDGAEGARFTSYLSGVLGDLRKLLL